MGSRDTCSVYITASHNCLRMERDGKRRHSTEAGLATIDMPHDSNIDVVDLGCSLSTGLTHCASEKHALLDVVL